MGEVIVWFMAALISLGLFGSGYLIGCKKSQMNLWRRPASGDKPTVVTVAAEPKDITLIGWDMHCDGCGTLLRATDEVRFLLSEDRPLWTSTQVSVYGYRDSFRRLHPQRYNDRFAGDTYVSHREYHLPSGMSLPEEVRIVIGRDVRATTETSVEWASPQIFRVWAPIQRSPTGNVRSAEPSGDWEDTVDGAVMTALCRHVATDMVLYSSKKAALTALTAEA